MATKTSKAKVPGKPPELKIGPFQGGIGVAVWLNEIQTDAGPKTIRSNVAKSVMWYSLNDRRFCRSRRESYAT